MLSPNRSDNAPHPIHAYTSWGMDGDEASYQRYVDSLEPCPGCGNVDEMDNIEGQLLCAACYLDEQSDDGEWGDCGDEEELRD